MARLQLDERRAQLLELGLRLFGDRSYEAVSIDDIAREAGVSKGLLYHYFGGKRDFYVEVVRLAADCLVAALHPDPDAPPPERARAGLLAYLDFVEQRAEAYRALTLGGLGADEEVHAILDEARGGVVDIVLQGVGVEPTRPVWRLAARSFVGAVEAGSLEWLSRRDVERDALVALFAAMLVGHLLAAARVDPVPGLELDAASLSALLG